MKAFRVKLSEGHSALPSQVVDGYLAENGKIQLYKGHEARDKAMKFGGIAEPYGKEFTIAPMQMAQLAYSELSPEIRSLLHREKKFISTTPHKGDDFYYGNVFDEILAELVVAKGHVYEELQVLSALCTNYIYVQILGE